MNTDWRLLLQIYIELFYLFIYFTKRKNLVRSDHHVYPEHIGGY